MPLANKDDERFRLCVICSSKLYIQKISSDFKLKKESTRALKEQLKDVKAKGETFDKQILETYKAIDDKKGENKMKLQEKNQPFKNLKKEYDSVEAEVNDQKLLEKKLEEIGDGLCKQKEDMFKQIKEL